MIILTAQLEVTHDNGYLCTRQYEDDKYNQQEAEQIIELVQPDGGEDEKQLDEDGPKWEDSAHQYGEYRLHVPDLIGNLPRDLIHPNWWILYRLPEAKVGAKECQWYRDSKPQSK